MRPEDAAITIASRLGLFVTEPVVLSDSNNVVLWLRPAPVVAKVATGHHRHLALELAVAKHLLAQGAPIVAPARELPPEVHHLEEMEVTFWAHQPPSKHEPDPHNVSATLSNLHEALLSYPARLPSYEDELSAVADLLDDAGRLDALSETDRALLLRALNQFQEELGRRPIQQQPLHGSPHAGNTLMVDGAVLFIDFETACLGPLEWDLAHVDDEVVNTYPARVDHALLEVCRGLVCAKTATWCWAKFEHPALRWHAQHHLRVVQALMADRAVS